MSSILTLLALSANAQNFDPQSLGDAWIDEEGEEIQYLDESYEGGTDIDKVVGGQQVTGDRWNATVGVIMQGYVGCTGTLIHPRVAVTAAHCVGGITDILIGSTDWMSDDGEIVPVEQTIGHPGYSGNSMYGGHDIAILKLGKKVTSIDPQPIALDCILDDYLKNGAPVQVVGFGATREDGNGWNTKMNQGGTFVQTADCSADRVEDYLTGCDPNTPGGEIGAGGDGVDACFGDSGGPLYLKTPEGDFLVGVTSRSYWGVPQNLPCKYGGIYTRPDYFIDWMEEASGVSLSSGACNASPELSAEAIRTKPGKTGYTALVVDDPDGDPAYATYEITVPPTMGTVTVDPTGLLAYTAFDSAAEGFDRFTVAVTDIGNASYDNTGDPVTIELEVPVEIKTGLFVSPSHAEGTGGCGCESTGTGAVGWLGILGALGLVRRRRD